MGGTTSVRKNDLDRKYEAAIENIEKLYRILGLTVERVYKTTLSYELPKDPDNYVPPLKNVLDEYIDVLLVGDEARKDLLSRWQARRPADSIYVINERQYRALELIYQLAVPGWSIVFHDVKLYHMHLRTFPVVGIQYRENHEEILKNLRVGWPVGLVREPHNPYDSKAVAVIVDGKHIGYLPQTMNRRPAQLLADDANSLVAFVEEVVPEKRRLSIDVYIRNAQDQ